MDVDAMLCDHAEVAEGKMFINGAGANICFVGPQPPHQITLFLAAILHVPYTATNQPHKLAVRVVHEDGEAVTPWVPDGAPEPGPLLLETEFNVGRPPQLPPGDSQPMPIAFGFPGLPLRSMGSYAFTIEIDGSEVKRLPFRLLQQPMPTGFGPASVPRL